MVNLVQILFVVLGVVVATYNGIWILRELVRMIRHPVPQTQQRDWFVMDDPGETARKIVMRDSSDMGWDWDGFDGFDC